MRCYFMRGGHIEAVEELPGLADEDAIAKAHALFAERKHLFEGFELWERARVLIRHPEPVASNSPGVWPLQRGLETRCHLGSSRFQPVSRTSRRPRAKSGSCRRGR